jgi:SAM-dependent methyltransferase
VTDVKLWSIAGGPESLAYRAFDTLRGFVNRTLSTYLYAGAPTAGARPLRILEAGSGPGYCSSLLAARGPVVEATILDLDADALRLAAARRDGVRIVQGDLYRLPFADHAFDLVFNSSTMEHLPAFDPALGEMVRVTRPGGRIFVGVPYKYGLFLPFNVMPARHPVSVWMGTLYSRDDLRRACDRADVVVTDWFYYFFGGFLGVLLARKA